MNLLDMAQLLGNFGEFAGAIAVVASLIYLAVQIRQNSTQIGLNSFQIATERYARLITAALQDPAKFEMFRNGLDSYSSLNPGQQAQFHSHMYSVYEDIIADSEAIPHNQVLPFLYK